MNAERFVESAQPLNKVLQPHRVVEEDAEGARLERSLSGRSWAQRLSGRDETSSKVSGLVVRVRGIAYLDLHEAHRPSNESCAESERPSHLVRPANCDSDLWCSARKNRRT